MEAKGKTRQTLLVSSLGLAEPHDDRAKRLSNRSPLGSRGVVGWGRCVFRVPARPVGSGARSLLSSPRNRPGPLAATRRPRKRQLQRRTSLVGTGLSRILIVLE